MPRSACEAASGKLLPNPPSRPLLPQLEALADVERAFVHGDYEKRSLPEHKVIWQCELFGSTMPTTRGAGPATCGLRMCPYLSAVA